MVDPTAQNKRGCDQSCPASGGDAFLTGSGLGFTEACLKSPHGEGAGPGGVPKAGEMEEPVEDVGE